MKNKKNFTEHPYVDVDISTEKRGAFNAVYSAAFSKRYGEEAGEAVPSPDEIVGMMNRFLNENVCQTTSRINVSVYYGVNRKYADD